MFASESRFKSKKQRARHGKRPLKDRKAHGKLVQTEEDRQQIKQELKNWRTAA